jgi:hypothetical protein
MKDLTYVDVIVSHSSWLFSTSTGTTQHGHIARPAPASQRLLQATGSMSTLPASEYPAMVTCSPCSVSSRVTGRPLHLSRAVAFRTRDRRTEEHGADEEGNLNRVQLAPSSTVLMSLVYNLSTSESDSPVNATSINHRLSG